MFLNRKAYSPTIRPSTSHGSYTEPPQFVRGQSVNTYGGKRKHKSVFADKRSTHMSDYLIHHIQYVTLAPHPDRNSSR